MKILKIHPATYIFFLLLIFTGFASLIIPYFIAVVLHELGHAYAAKKMGYKLNKIYLLPYGACLSFEEFAFNPQDEIKIAIAGPLTNICVIIVCMALWWIFPISYLFTYAFVISNFSLAFFNLLPAYPLDGGRVLVGLLSAKNKSKLAYKIVTILNILISAIFLILFIISFFVKLNFSFGLMAIFLFVGIIESRFQGKYNPLLYEFSSRPKKNVVQVKSIYVELSTPIYKIASEINYSKFNLIYVQLPNGKLKVLTESTIKQILLKHKPNETLKDCLKI